MCRIGVGDVEDVWASEARFDCEAESLGAVAGVNVAEAAGVSMGSCRVFAVGFGAASFPAQRTFLAPSPIAEADAAPGKALRSSHSPERWWWASRPFTYEASAVAPVTASEIATTKYQTEERLTSKPAATGPPAIPQTSHNPPER